MDHLCFVDALQFLNLSPETLVDNLFADNIFEELKRLYDLYQADLVEMIRYAELNNVHRYLMTVINVFSKFSYPIPLKTKTSEEVAHALEPILAGNGKEHYNSDVQ